MTKITVTLALVFMINQAMIAQWTGGSNTAPYVRLNPSNDEYGVVMSDAPQGFSNPDAKLLVSVVPNFHNGVVSEFRGRSMLANQDVLRLRLSAQPSSQTPNPFYIRGLTNSGSTIFSIDSRGGSIYKGGIRLLDFDASTSSNTAIQVRGDQGLWYNGVYFSWGFGGEWNRFADPITIGSGTEPSSNTGLRVDQNKHIDIIGGDVRAFGGDINVLGGDVDLDSGNIDITNGGTLNIEGPNLRQIFFKRDPATVLGKIESGGNFLRLDDLTQVIIAAGGQNKLQVSAFEGALFDTNITLRSERNIQFGNNVLLPEALISLEEIANQDYGRMRIKNEIENGQVLITTDKGDISLNNGIGGGVFIQDRFVGISEKNPQHTLHVTGDVGITGEFFALSDRRVKEDITELAEAKKMLLDLHPVTYTYKTKAYENLNLSDDFQYGLIAQEVEQILPSLITVHSKVENDEGESIDLKGVNYTSIIPILIKGYQEQQEELEFYKRSLDSVIRRLEDLEKKISDQ